MTSPLLRHALPRVLPLLLLALAIPLVAFAQPPAPGLSELAPEVRERLSQAAADTLLPAWQRDVMLRLARTGRAAALDPPATAAAAALPALASGAADGAWTAAAIRPSARFYHSAIYDPVRDRMVLFGGYTGADSLDDVWVLSLAGTPAWTQLTPTGTPPSGRYRHSAIYDPVRDRMVVFGGCTDSRVFNDVWALSLAGTPAWTQLTPTGTPPIARFSHSAIYDPVRDRMVVFGGYKNYSYLNEVWALSLAGTPAWTQLTPTGTPPIERWGHSAIYDPVRDRMVVFGGYCTGQQVRNDVWALSLAGTPAWTQLTPTGAPPGARCDHSAIYDPVRDRMVVFGGDDDLPQRRLGAVAGGHAGLDAAGARRHAAGHAVRPQRDLRPGARPHGGLRGHRGHLRAPGRRLGAVAGGHAGLDAADAGDRTERPQRDLRPGARPHGGLRGRPPYSSSYLNDVWALSLAGTPAWTQLTPTGTPPSGRSAYSAIYDPVRDRMVVFGRQRCLGRLQRRLGAVAGGHAGLDEADARPARRRARGSPQRDLRPGARPHGGLRGLRRHGSHLNDVWALSLADTPAWTQLTPTGTPPSGRVRAQRDLRPGARPHGGLRGICLRPGPLQRCLGAVAGGHAGLDAAGAHRHACQARGASTARSMTRCATAWWSSEAVITGSYFNDTWALSLADTPAWTQLIPAGTPPVARYGHSANYDPVRDRMVVFGGRNASGFLNDVWSLTWGAPALASVTCPGDIIWSPGGSISASYSITNPNGFAQTADYTLSSARNWPGFPVSGSVSVGANATVAVPLSAPVPDSAAGGWSTLTFGATLLGVPQYAACVHNLVDEATPVTLSLVSAQAEPGLVRLTWYAASGIGSVATVYRSVVSGPWSAVGKVAPDGSGQLVYEDRAVLPGARYGYRLGVMDQGREVFAGETWVEVPLTAELALGGVRPNPATQALAVTFSLPDASPARLEAFDLAGRRVAAREVGPLGGGSHEVRLGESRPLAPGIYLLRLTRGERVLKARAVIVR